MSDLEKQIQELKEEFQQLKHQVVKQFMDHIDLQQRQISSRRGPEGPRGLTGEPSNVPGPVGRTGTVRIGSVVGGPEAQVTNSGTMNDAVLNFVLPQGEASTVPGPQGIAGRDAADGRHGKDGLNRDESEALVHKILADSSVVKEANVLLTILKVEVERLQNAVKTLKSL